MRRILLAATITLALSAFFSGSVLAQNINHFLWNLDRDNYGRGFRIGATSPAGCSIDKSKDSHDNNDYSDKDSSRVQGCRRR